MSSITASTSTNTARRMHADVLDRHGIDPDRPYVLFVGRITRQKGILHLLHAIPHLDPALQVVLCAGAPDTPEIGREMERRRRRARSDAAGRDLDPRHAAPRRRDPALYPCRACSAARRSTSRSASSISRRWPATRRSSPPRSAASRRSWCPTRPASWSIPDLRPGSFEPADPAAFAAGLADGINRLAENAGLAGQVGRRGPARVRDQFTWDAIAAKTEALYRQMIGGSSR